MTGLPSIILPFCVSHLHGAATMDMREMVAVVGVSQNAQVPHQLGALTFYRYEQPIVDYCQAHQPLRLNMGYQGPPQGLEGLEDLGPCDRGTIQTVALPALPTATSIGAPVPGPRSPPPSLRPATEGPSSGPFLPAERTGTLKFGR